MASPGGLTDRETRLLVALSRVVLAHDRVQRELPTPSLVALQRRDVAVETGRELLRAVQAEAGVPEAWMLPTSEDDDGVEF